MTKPFDAVLCKDVVVAAAESFFECSGQAFFWQRRSRNALRPSLVSGVSYAWIFSFSSQTSFAPIFVCFLLEGSVICFQKLHRRLVVQASNFAFDHAAFRNDVGTGAAADFSDVGSGAFMPRGPAEAVRLRGRPPGCC